jgi:hypothetical protein
MKISDFNRELEVKNIDEIEAILRIRYAPGYNSFWLRHEELYPYISILAKADLAYVHYFPGDRQAGFRSVGNVANLEGEMSMFRLRTINEEQPILNDAVVTFSDALTVAKEFFHAKSLPRSIEWLEL